MKRILLDLLICPSCLPEEHALQESVTSGAGDDIEEGELRCPACKRVFFIRDGIADLDPNGSRRPPAVSKYETGPVVSSYLWSHYGDLLGDELASDAYENWLALMRPHQGLALDAGAAVGRYTFGMGQKSDLAVGLDTSRAFIRTARELMRARSLTFPLKIEGSIATDVTLSLPLDWRMDTVEFIVADAMALPFRSGAAGSFASLNLIDKVPGPLGHLREMNRVTREADTQFLLSDPFSWSEDAAVEEEWLGGRVEGPFQGRGRDNIMALLREGTEGLTPAWRVKEQGEVWWRIRTHANHYEQIRSCYLKAER
ncbi:MAG: Trm112 family protein [Desulfobulbaceae bacterium]